MARFLILSILILAKLIPDYWFQFPNSPCSVNVYQERANIKILNYFVHVFEANKPEWYELQWRLPLWTIIWNINEALCVHLCASACVSSVPTVLGTPWDRKAQGTGTAARPCDAGCGTSTRPCAGKTCHRTHTSKAVPLSAASCAAWTETTRPLLLVTHQLNTKQSIHNLS